jgi:hypothetical protein
MSEFDRNDPQLWKLLPSECQFIAMNKPYGPLNARWVGHKKKPRKYTKNIGFWSCGWQNSIYVEEDIKPIENWEESLTERPKN